MDNERKATGTPIRELFAESDRFAAIEARLDKIEHNIQQLAIAGQFSDMAGVSLCNAMEELTSEVKALKLRGR